MGILSASTVHKSRLHNMDGKLIPFSRLLRNAPRAALTGLGRKLFDKRPELPWISYDAQAEIARRLGAGSRALEFGAGMSTAWFASRVDEIVSIEDDEKWHGIVCKNFAARGISNARIRFAGSKNDYLTLTDEEVRGGFDFVLIDGRYRDECVDVAIRHLKPGGCIYLDNSDQIYEDEPNGSCARARIKLLDWVKSTDGSVLDFTDFAPTLFFVTRGELFTGR